MLLSLSIRNFAIISSLEVEFAAGMTVLTGETGAGKSILVDALNLILGDRADALVIRDGCERADLSASFDLHDAPAAAAWLAEHALESDGECIIRRLVARAGRSRCWINGHPVPARELRALGEQLVNIHGQHAHQALLRSATQRALVDEFGGHEQLLAAAAAAAAALRATAEQIAAIEQIDASGALRSDLLRYQVDELQALGLAAGEYEAIVDEHKRLASAEHLIAQGQRIHSLLQESEDNAVIDQLGLAERLLAELIDIDSAFAPVAEMLTDARIQAQEAAATLRQHVDTLELDPERFAELEARLGSIQDLARKHQVAPAELPALNERLAAELAELENAGQRLQALKEQQTMQLQAYRNAAAELSAARVAAASRLDAKVTKILRTLGMAKGELQIDVTHDAEATPGPLGTDHVTYLFSANPGQAARALERVASGGELSRISLAIEVVTASTTRAPTLVFDEVDTGIGGGVAEIVGRQLRQLGASGQTLCVTHLPQVAALAENHLRVDKQVAAGQTSTRVTQLDDVSRVEELARMLGGVDISAQTLAHAQDMLQRAAPVGAE